MKPGLALLMVALTALAGSVQADTATAIGGDAIVGDHNVIGITTEEYEAKVKERTTELTAEIDRLREQERKLTDLGLYASQQSVRLRGEIDQRQRELAAAQAKLADVEASYAQLQATVTDLTAQLDDLASRGRVPNEVLGQAKAALQAGDLDLARSIVDGLIEDPTFEEMAREQAELYSIAGQVALERIDYATAMARRVRAAQLAPDVAIYQNQAGYTARLAGGYGEAEYFARRYLALVEAAGRDGEDRATALNNLALDVNDQGRYAEAEPLFAKALEIRREVLGERHPDTAESYNNVAVNLDDLGRYAEAEPLYAKALEIRREVFGERHRGTALSYNNVAFNLYFQGRYAEAEPLFAKALEIRREVLGERHPDTAQSYNNIAANLGIQGRYAEAEPLLSKALEIRREVLGERHPYTAQSYNNIAANLVDQGRHTEAEPLYAKALEIRREVLGERHPDTAWSYNNVAMNLYSQGRFAEAEPLLVKALEISREVLGDAHPSTVFIATNSVGNLVSLGRYQQGDDLALDALGPDDPVRLDTLPLIALEAYRAGDFERAAVQWTEALRLAYLHDYDPLRTAVWRQNLAKLRYKQGRFEEADALYAEAFPVLLEGYADDPEKLAHLAANYARNLREAPETADRVARLRELQARFGESAGTVDYRP